MTGWAGVVFVRRESFGGCGSWQGEDKEGCGGEGEGERNGAGEGSFFF